MKKLNLRFAALVAAIAVIGAVRIYAAITQSSTNVPLAIPDNGNVNSTLNFTVAGTISDVNLTVDVTHTWDADIQLTLTSPTVAAQVLWHNCGGSGDNLTNTILDEQAAGLATCAFAGAPFTGSFQPTDGQTNTAPTPIHATGNLANFNGATSGGTWTLNVADDSSVCTGTLNAWSLTIDGPPPLPVELMKFEAN